MYSKKTQRAAQELIEERIAQQEKIDGIYEIPFGESKLFISHDKEHILGSMTVVIEDQVFYVGTRK